MISFRRKIIDFAALADVLQPVRASGRSVVMCHGCFDIVHPGHIRYLEFARRQGDVLLVTLTGDSHVDKGPDRPYIPEALRAENLAALECVDWVAISTEPNVAELLAQIQPDIYVKGREYENSRHPGFVCERDVVEGYGGRVIFSSGDVTFSSTKLLASNDRRQELGARRLEWLCQRHEVDHPTIESFLDDFAHRRVLVVGDLVVDRYIECDAVDVASEAPMLSLRKLGQTDYVGGAAIVARHIAAMGGRSCLVSAAPRAGADPVADAVRETLEAEGVEHDLLPVRDAVPIKTRCLVEETKVLKLDDAERCPLDSQSELEVATRLTRQAREADAVILCDFGYGMLTAGLLARVMPALRREVQVVTADVSGPWARLTSFQHVDLLTPTERELRSSLADFDQGLSTAAWNLLKLTQARHLFVTLGKRGVVVFERASQDPRTPEWSGRLRSEHLPSFASTIADRLGCGDAMLAASTLALACGANPVQAAYLGSAAAALELARPGNVPVDGDALRRWLHTRAELLCGTLDPCATDAAPPVIAG